MHNDSDHHNESLRSVTFSRGARPRHPRAVWSTPAPPGSRGYLFSVRSVSRVPIGGVSLRGVDLGRDKAVRCLKRRGFG